MGSNRYRLVLALLVAISMHGLFGQSLLFPTDYFFDAQRQAAILRDTETVVHTSMQPYLYKTVVPDTLKRMKYDADGFFDKLLYENLVQVRHTDRSSGYPRKFNFDINPLFAFNYGRDFADTGAGRVQTNTRGFWIKGEFGKKVWFESAFMENQSFFPPYLVDAVKPLKVIPGHGRFKAFKQYGYDYASAYGILNFTVADNFQLRAGHGKQKVGNGYRSLLLSDNAFNYPYVQAIWQFCQKKFQYAQTYALLMNLTTGGAKTPPHTEPIFQKKPASFQQLSWHTGRHFDLYFFQGMIWEASDKNNITRVDPYYFNPLIFSNLAAFGFNHTNHILAGGGFELRLFSALCVYGQLMYDGTYLNTTNNKREPNVGYQGGVKYYDAFGARGLFIQCEANMLQGNSYYSDSSPYQHYSHYNQLLSTPLLLPNEVIAMAAYSVKRVFIRVKHNVGFANTPGVVLNFFDAQAGYLFNPHYNFNIAIGTNVRSFLQGNGAPAHETQIFYVSLRTSLFNTYFDF